MTFTITDIGGACPTQATGRYTATDQPFYFRARHGMWTLQVGEPGWLTDYCYWPAWIDEVAPIAQGDDPTHGWMETDDVVAIIAANVPPVVVEGEVVLSELPAGTRPTVVEPIDLPAWLRSHWEQFVAEAKRNSPPCADVSMAGRRQR